MNTNAVKLRNVNEKLDHLYPLTPALSRRERE
jgi:hypothetical protein